MFLSKQQQTAMKKKTIAQLESAGHKAVVSHAQAEMELYRILHFLEMTGRFRENKKYSDVSFAAYLDGVFAMKPYTYERKLHAYMNHLPAVERFGIGIISKIDQSCGRQMIDYVVSVLTGIADKDLTHKRILAVIQQHTIKFDKPKAARTKDKPLDKMTEKEKGIEITRLRSENTALTAEITKLKKVKA